MWTSFKARDLMMCATIGGCWLPKWGGSPLSIEEKFEILVPVFLSNPRGRLKKERHYPYPKVPGKECYP